MQNGASGVKVPFPLPWKTVAVLSVWLRTTKSWLPSLLKSAETIPLGAFPAAMLLAVSDTPVLEFATWKKLMLEGPPPGAGATTEMFPVPADIRLADGIVAVSWCPLTKVVASGAPFQFTTDVVPKPAPFTVIRVLPLPGAALDGLIAWATKGSGLFSDAVPVPVKFTNCGLSPSTPQRPWAWSHSKIMSWPARAP